MPDNLTATEPIVAYRWFQVGSGGRLAGAQDVEWPVDEPLRARHVGSLEDSGSVFRVLTIVVGIAAVVCAVALLAGLVGLVWLLATGGGSALDRVGVGMDIVGAGGGLVLALVMEAMAPLPMPGPGHRCPGPAPRLVARWTPPCGIYAYRDLAGAAAGAQGGWIPTGPVVLAQVLLWGSVWEHRSGYRAELARVEALYDDGRGHVEVPAARYGVAVLDRPVDLVAARSMAGLVQEIGARRLRGHS